MVGVSPLTPRCREDSYRSFGMSQRVLHAVIGALLWPKRTPTGSFCLLESQTQRYVEIEHAGFLHPLGLRHFYDGFRLRAEISIRFPALEVFQLQEEEVSPDLVLSRAAVAARG